jgi:hypothetical protein
MADQDALEESSPPVMVNVQRRPMAANDRLIAHRLRNRLTDPTSPPLSDEEAVWLDTYEKRVQASRSASHTVEYREERKEAEGAASVAIPLAEALMAREDGRRIDKLIEVSIGALTTACSMYAKMATDMMAERQEFFSGQMTMMGSLREHYLARIDAEGDALKAQSADQTELGEITGMMKEFGALKEQLDEAKEKKLARKAAEAAQAEKAAKAAARAEKAARHEAKPVPNPFRKKPTASGRDQPTPDPKKKKRR